MAKLNAIKSIRIQPEQQRQHCIALRSCSNHALSVLQPGVTVQCTYRCLQLPGRTPADQFHLTSSTVISAVGDRQAVA